jgi:hypothetical protein
MSSRTIPIRQVSDDQRKILECIELADGEGCVLAADIAGVTGLSKRGMGGRMAALVMHGFVKPIVVKPRASYRSDTTYGYVLTETGREVL